MFKIDGKLAFEICQRPVHIPQPRKPYHLSESIPTSSLESVRGMIGGSPGIGV